MAAARIIQRHVDREVRKAVKRARQNAETLLIQSATESGYAAKMEVVKCAEVFTEKTLVWSRERNYATQFNLDMASRDLVHAVKAMKEGKK